MSPAWISNLGLELRGAYRRCRRRWAFTATVVVTFGLGLAAATAIFSVVSAALLAPLPWPSSDRLVLLYAMFTERRSDPRWSASWNRQAFSWEGVQAIRKADALEAVGVWRSVEPMVFGEARNAIVPAMSVSAGLIPMFAGELLLGRGFTDLEDSAPSDAALITHGCWQNRFGGQRDIIGQQFVLTATMGGDSRSHVVVGVLAPSFRFFGGSPEFLLPLGNAVTAGGGSYRLVGRLRTDVASEAASATLEAVVQSSETRRPTSVRLVPLANELRGRSARALWLLFGGSALLLAISAANVVGLLLGDARIRRPEVALRLALGATPGRVVRQLTVDHALLAVGGTVVGLVLAVWTARWILAIAPPGTLWAETVRLDFRVAAFAIGAAAIMTLVSSVLPALSLGWADARYSLGNGDRTSSHHLRGQRVIVALEIALAAVLLIGAHLFSESMLRLTTQPLGFDPSDLTIATTRYTGSNTPLMARGLPAETATVLERVAALPYVTSVAAASAAPFFGQAVNVGVHTPDNQRDIFRAQHQVVTERYLETVRTPVLMGRSFRAGDRSGPPVAVVSAEFERQFLGGSGLGRRFVMQGGPTFEVVGIVADVRQRGFLDTGSPTFYALDGRTGGFTDVVVRTEGNTRSMPVAVRDAISEVAPYMVVTESSTMEGKLRDVVAEERFRAVLSLGYAGIALALAAIGVYTLSARRVAERRREFGIRLAMGATAADVRKVAVRDALWVVTTGLALGVPMALAVSQMAASLLYGVKPTAPHVVALTSVVLALAGGAAALGAVRKAGEMEPGLILRDDL